MDQLSITVQDSAELDTLRPVTGGVPIAQGSAPEGVNFNLKDHQGNIVPLQTSILGRWKDNSIRWLLLDFQSTPPKNGKLDYVLSWSATTDSPLIRTSRNIAEKPIFSYGEITISSVQEALLSVSKRFLIDLSLIDGEGQVFKTSVESTSIETEGDLRSTLSIVGSFQTHLGNRSFQFRLRTSIFSGLSKIRLEPIILIDSEEGVLQRIQELKLTIKPLANIQSFRLGGSPEWKGTPSTNMRLFQFDDQNYTLEGTEGKGEKAPGWAAFEDDQGLVSVVLRDFWQQWPKSLETSSEGLSIGLFPRFQENDYAHMEPWYKYQYLFEGDSYRVRTGQARRWEIWLDLNGEGDSLARAANAPLVPAANPAQAIATGVWDAIVPAGTPEMADYDAWAENLFNGYCYSIEIQRDYGEMNWGDWFGERQVNWGNHEYDTTNQILIQYARTGDPRYFYVADTAARHSSEVDTVHFVNEDLRNYFNEHWGRSDYPPRSGMVHQHAVGHVGCFYPVKRIHELYIEKRNLGWDSKPYLCLDPFNLGHVWTQGLMRQYFLTGDPFLKETVERIGDNLAQLVEDREYKFMGHTHCGRTTGWPLLALSGSFEISLNEQYSKAMKTLVEDALNDQDPVCGGWLIHPMAPDHCLCKIARHTGMAGFITAVLINGLSRYYLLSGDERLPDAIDRAVTFLDNDTWREELEDWRYTSCPSTGPTQQPGVVVMAHVNSIRITDNPSHLRVLNLAWKSKFRRLLEKIPAPSPGQGKFYSSTMYGCAEAIGLLVNKKTSLSKTV